MTTKVLITRKKFFSIERGNPYRTRKIKIEGRLSSPTTIEVNVRQIDWTLKRKVDEREESYLIDAEFDYVGLINYLYRELNHIKSFTPLVEKWVEGKRATFYYQFCGEPKGLHSAE